MPNKQILLLLVLSFLLVKVESDDCTDRFDYYIESYCNNLQINTTHNCKYSKGICDYNYVSCSSYEGKDISTCQSIIPYNNYKKCVIEGEICTEVDKDCDDYETELICSSLKAGENKRCVVNSKNNKCEAHYSLCSGFTTGVDKEKCEANIPYDYSTKCEWDNNACKDVYKKCNDYTSSTPSSGCRSLETSDDDKKICIASTNGYGCVEQFKTCELYNENTSSKTKSDCEAIRTFSNGDFDDSKICSFSGNVCSTKDKSCENILTGDCCCEQFIPKDTDKICIYDGSQCKEQYKTCELYNEKVTSKSKEQCESIRVYSNGKFNNQKKCTFSGTKCETADKTCEDIDEDNCEYFQPTNTNIKCILKEDKCKSQYKTCELYNLNVDDADKNSNECLSIRTFDDSLNSFDDSKICSFSGNTCSTRDKTCGDIKEEKAWSNFHPTDTDKICIYSGSQCKEQYKTCQIYNDKVTTKNKDECEAIRIYDNYRFDTSSQCLYNTDTSTCSKSKKPCSSFTTSSECNNHIPNDSNKQCIFIGNECKELYKTCELYEANENNKNEPDCKNIVPYESDNLYQLDNDSKCVFSNSHCTRKSKDCSEMTGSYDCIYHTLDDNNKKCIYENSQCKAVYKSCDDYNNVANKNADECKAITLYDSYGNINYRKKCIYEGETCQEKTLSECSDYEPGKDGKYCTNIPAKTYKKCIIKDGNCVEEFTDCPEDQETVSQEICKSIQPNDGYHKCIFESNKCIQTLKSCTEYEVKNYYICEYELKHGENKRCFYENEKCIERYIYCESYTGNNKEECESIIPYQEGSSSTSLGTTYKCVMETEGCKKKEKQCEETKNQQQCGQIYNNLKKNNMMESYRKCKYDNINSNCFEQYIDCDAYTNSGETVEKGICESIILEGDSNINSKCVFVSGSPNKCQKMRKECSDINFDNYKDYCPTITPSLGKKCIYSNSACKENNMSCKELENKSGVTESICSAAPTSDSARKKCEIKSDGSGCQESDKPNDNKGNLGHELKFSLLIAIIALLI